ncbi:hypothetical protein H5410_032476 [Solanum commersonii]|uniref:Uncharacterized protein n=1 Tax=Solanum commersonii TaxID=4109 RepID=A0A9J5YL31_SOLCO|nr:hypothetical protein H5410_032476 [Solanum commersonii]
MILSSQKAKTIQEQHRSRIKEWNNYSPMPLDIPSQLLLTQKRESLGDFHQYKGHKLVYARKHEGSFGMLKSGWKSVREQGEMEDCPSLHLVDYLAGKESEMFREQELLYGEDEAELFSSFQFLV